MRDQDDGFAECITRFEADHGPMDTPSLLVVAQANYLCWYEAGFPNSLVRVCEALGSGKTQPMTLCLHVSPERWRALHGHVVAVQRWLGDSRAVPGILDRARVAELQRLLGAPEAARIALSKLFLSTLVEHLLHNVSFGQLSADGTTDDGAYCSFSSWYGRPDGGPHRAPRDKGEIALRSAQVRKAMADSANIAEDLLRGLLRPSQPPCGQRFLRYQEIRMASIGALRWRGDLPPTDTPRSHWLTLFHHASKGLESWLAGEEPQSGLTERLHTALGDADARKRALVAIFLMQPPTPGFFGWLKRISQERGITPATCFSSG